MLLPVIEAGLKAAGLLDRGIQNACAVQRREMTLALPGLPPAYEGYRILHLSDLHFGRIAGFEDILAGLVQDLPTDVVALTGDYRWATAGPYEHVITGFERLLSRVQAKDGVFATLGNHDPGMIVDGLERLGVRVLLNETVTLRRGADLLHLTGVDDPSYFYTTAAVEALRDSPAGFKIALVHSPDLLVEAAEAGYALYLCGHTHGGQVCLPGGRPVFVGRICVGRHYALGLWRHGGMTGFTSPGAGVSNLPARFFSRGEVTVLTLHPA